MNSRPVQRIQDVIALRAGQFSEDDGPMAHPVRPDSYIKVCFVVCVVLVGCVWWWWCMCGGGGACVMVVCAMCRVGRARGLSLLDFMVHSLKHPVSESLLMPCCVVCADGQLLHLHSVQQGASAQGAGTIDACT